LNPELETLRSRAGQNLGIVFTRDFKRDMDALIAQVQALSGFAPFGAATAPGAAVVRPAATQADVNARIAESAASLAQIVKDAKTLSKEEQAKVGITNGLLRELIRLLGGSGKRGAFPGGARGLGGRGGD
jgi:hypothetical protein